MTKRTICRGGLLLLAAGAVCTAGLAAPQNADPTNLTADRLTYDTRTGVVTAEGGVHVDQGTGNIEGARATYNTKTQEGTIEGNVRAQREDMNLSCDRLLAAGQEHWQASGSVHMAKAGRTFTKLAIGGAAAGIVGAMVLSKMVKSRAKEAAKEQEKG